MKKVGAKKGNKNAKKYRKPKRYSLSLEMSDLKQWAKLAKNEGISLNAWIIEKVNGGVV